MDSCKNPIGKQQSCSLHKLTAMGLLITMGIVFGDIGTSPLYVMKAITGVNPNYDADYIIGAISCVIWTLTLQTTFKYVIIALRADNKGEGGILALYSYLKNSRHKWLYIVSAIGAATLVADGVITPAVTVSSAIEGLRIINPEIPVLPIVATIICCIFLMQQAGTGKIGKMFGPFMLIWFLMLGILGCMSVNLAPEIWKAFNPWYAIKLLINFPGWFLILGAVFLCTTGAEALYSDLGHCGRLNISISWIFVKIMLILNYMGQGAWLISNSEAGLNTLENPFFGIMPSWFTIYGIIMSTGAAIIASQALLSGSYTIFSEAGVLTFWPHLHIKYPSKEKGQLYIPSVNWCLLFGCLLTVVIFQDSSRMEAAYGLAITITMLMTTVLLTFYLRKKGVPTWLCALFLIFFAIIEGIFFTANMFKFTHGGWYTLLIAGMVAFVMIVWRKSTIIRNTFIEYKNIGEYSGIISDIKSDGTIPKTASNLVYFSRSPELTAIETKLAYSIINKRPKRADHYWIINVENDDSPNTCEYDVKIIIPQTLYLVKIRLGYKVEPKVSIYLRQIVEDLVDAGKLDLTSDYPSLRKRDIPGDFRFIIIHRLFSYSATCGRFTGFMLKMHEILRHLGLSHSKAMGLDTSNVSVEMVPLIIDNTSTVSRIQRVRADNNL